MSRYTPFVTKATWYSRHTTYDAAESIRWSFEMTCDAPTMRTIRANIRKAQLYHCLNWEQASIDCFIKVNFTSQPNSQFQRITGYIEFPGSRTGRFVRTSLAAFLARGYERLFSIWVWPYGMAPNKPVLTPVISRKRMWHYYSGV